MTNDVPTYGMRRADVLCLSGPGYRAALFHLGALTRLNELGLLARVETVGAVAGGSILAALLAARIPWPLQGPCHDWSEAVAEPMRSISRRSVPGRAQPSGPVPGVTVEAALEERYARELAGSLEPAQAEQPRFVFGAAGLTLGQMAGHAGESRGQRWEINAAADPGYDPALVAEVIARLHTDLGAFGEAEQAVLENHGYLLADAAVRGERPPGKEIEPPHPDWMSEARVREALATSPGRGHWRRLFWR